MAGAAKEVHFEVFTRQGARGSWKLHEVVPVRDEAVSMARMLLQTAAASDVKVVKETYDAQSGDYLSLKIFEDGQNHSSVDPAADDVPSSLPCFKPDDLYSYHARATITRLLSEYLARQKITITELIHRADALEKFEATGTIYQHAIQRIAVAQAASTKKPVAQIIKELNELITKAIGRVYRDHRKGVFPKIAPEQFCAFAIKVSSASNATYLINGAIARHLADASGWDEKLSRLLTLLTACEEQTASQPHGQLLLRTCIDAITAEILSGSAALHELIGNHENLGDALSTLIHLFLGQFRTDKDCGQGVALLTRHFKSDLLPDARTAVANRVMAELKSNKKLTGDDLLDEIGMLRRIANKLVLGQGKYLSHEDIIAAFTLRSQRMVTYEVLARFLEPIAAVDERLEKLLLIEESIIGAANKRQLAGVMLPIAQGQAFAALFHDTQTPVLTRLQRLCELQGRVLRSTIPDPKRRELADVLDRVASDVETKARILDSLAAKPMNPVEKVQTLIKLLGNAVFTEGCLAARARAQTLSLVQLPGFIAAYAEHSGAAETAARAELMASLAKVGVGNEAKSAAA